MSAGGAPDDDVDVIIVGAGVSGIGAGCRLRQLCPGLSFRILERRANAGGTWDLFKYPGIRSDSETWTYAYPFKPWRHEKTIAPGPAIVEYLEETVREHDLAKHMRFGEEVRAAAFSSADARWRVATAGGRRYSARFLFMGGGYYAYDPPFTPPFEGRELFRGAIVHPQTWPQDTEYAGKRVVVIGSGATAVTLIPVLAERAAHVVMLQRSPSYIGSRDSDHQSFRFLKPYIPEYAYFQMNRWKEILNSTLGVTLCKWYPEKMKEKVLEATTEALAGAKVDIAKDFTPRYNPWEQRFCLIPDADFFDAVKSGKVSVVTSEIQRFTERGILLRDGAHVDADLIVTATGMHVQDNLPFGGIAFSIDGGPPIRGADQMIYKSCMLTGVPNFTFSFGYLAGGSWTLKSDLTAVFMCRLLNYMRERGLGACCPQRDPSMQETSMHSFSSTYLDRVGKNLPKCGTSFPWTRPENYLTDYWTLRFSSLQEKSMRFTKFAKARL